MIIIKNVIKFYRIILFLFIIISIIAKDFDKSRVIFLIIKFFNNKFIIINEYRLYYINIKNVIIFIIFYIKKYYNAYYFFRILNINNFINLKFHKNY